MRRSTNRLLTGAFAALVSVCALGAAAPAHAETNDTPLSGGTIVTITQDVTALGSPRENTAPVTAVLAGESVEALCAFANAGSDWVKIQTHALFGFVPSSAVEGSTNSLPRECPSEITSITIPAPGLNFGSVAWGVSLEGFTCPAGYPFLDARTNSGGLGIVDAGYSQIPGLRIDRTIGVGFQISKLITTDDPKGSGRYVAGYANVTVSNHLPVGKATLFATCTNDARLAQPAA